ncbi:MAG: hypothetical protein AAF222_09035 [Pseudomonadota bacterium]
MGISWPDTSSIQIAVLGTYRTVVASDVDARDTSSVSATGDRTDPILSLIKEEVDHA